AFVFFSSRRRHTSFSRDWSSDVCSSDLVTIVYDIGEPKPFRQVWNIVLTLNDLDYVLLENDVIVVGTTSSVNRLRAPAPEAPEEIGRASCRGGGKSKRWR